MSAAMMWKVYVLENGKWKQIYNKRWMPTTDDMGVVHKVLGKQYRVINPQGKDVTGSFNYGEET